MTRIAAHSITFEGRTYHMSVIELAAGEQKPRIYPLTEEIHSTRFINGSIEVKVTDKKLCVIEP